MTQYRILLLAIFALCHAMAHAARPVFDEVTAGIDNNGVTTHAINSFSSVTGGSWKGAFIVERSISDFFDTVQDPTDGNWPMVTDGTDSIAIASVGNRIEVFGQENATVAIDTASGTSSSAVNTRVGSFIYDGVHTTLPYGNVVIGTFTATTTPSIAITTTYTDVTVLCFEVVDTTGTVAPGDTETERFDYGSRMQMQEIDATTPGTFTCNWTLGTSSTGAMAAVELKSTTSALAGGGFNPILGPTHLPGTVQ